MHRDAIAMCAQEADLPVIIKWKIVTFDFVGLHGSTLKSLFCTQTGLSILTEIGSKQLFKNNVARPYNLVQFSIKLQNMSLFFGGGGLTGKNTYRWCTWLERLWYHCQKSDEKPTFQHCIWCWKIGILSDTSPRRHCHPKNVWQKVVIKFTSLLKLSSWQNFMAYQAIKFCSENCTFSSLHFWLHSSVNSELAMAKSAKKQIPLKNFMIVSCPLAAS